jgi:hypothetical protein
MKSKCKLLMLSVFVSAVYINVNAVEMSEQDVMQKNVANDDCIAESSDITMKLITKNGSERVRKVTQLSKDLSNTTKGTLIKFLYPADVKNTGLLTLEEIGKEDDVWLYLPALKKSRRISAGDKTDNFMGSDFTFEDLDKEDVAQCSYKLIKKEQINGSDCYVIEAVYNNEKRMKESGYSKRILWIQADNYVTAKAEFYDKKGILQKIMSAEDIRKLDTKWRAHKVTMKTLKTNNETVLLYDNVVIDGKVDPEMLTKRALEAE